MADDLTAVDALLDAAVSAVTESRSPDAEVLRTVLKVADRYREQGALEPLARASAFAASLAVGAGDLSLAFDQAIRALVILGGNELDAVDHAATSNSLGVTFFRLGAWDEAIELFDRAAQVVADVPERWAVSAAHAAGAALVGHREARSDAPRTARFLAVLRQATERLEQAGAAGSRGSITIVCRAYLHLADGNVEAAAALVDALAGLAPLGQPADSILLPSVTAYVRERQGRVDDALAQYACARELLASNHDRVATQLLRDTAELATRAGRVDEALVAWRLLADEQHTALAAGLGQLVAGLSARAEWERTQEALVHHTQSLADEAMHDPLTGLENRRAMSALIARSAGNARPVTLLMLDLDHFKAVNDSYGHAVGDDVLRTFGEILRTALRPDDIAIRSGGEEFTIVLVRRGRSTGLVVAERIRRFVAEHPWDEIADGLHVTVSVGVADGRASEIERLALGADRALYDAKRAGRDRVVLATAH
jgi:two-component system, cell cycle response regulator